VSGIRSTLARHIGAMRDPDPAAARRAARAAYHETGLILINPDWLTSWVDQQALRNIADQVHGKRKTKA
jgi:hypothetical protein